MSSLKALDAFPKLHEEFKVKTNVGAVVSLVAIVLMAMLFLSETAHFLSTNTRDKLDVDTQLGGDIEIDFDISFPRVPCSFLSVDVMDIAGSQQLDVDHDIVKTRLDENGKALEEKVQGKLGEGKLSPQDLKIETTEQGQEENKEKAKCGSCFGAQDHDSQCCNTCAEVYAAYRKKGWQLPDAETIEQCASEVKNVKRVLNAKEGCKISGALRVQKVAGNFHIAPGHGAQQAFAHVHDVVSGEAILFDISHKINYLSFGKHYPGRIDPLDNADRFHPIRTLLSTFMPDFVDGGIYQYYVKVVPTSYRFLNGTEVPSNQYSVTEYASSVRAKPNALPGVFFFYDVSPLRVDFREERRSFSHYITQLCAIIGGVFTVAGLIDRFLYESMRKMEKVKLGKFS